MEVLFLILFLALYALMVWHVWASPRTPRSIRTFWLMMTAVFGVPAYLVWFLFRDKKMPQGAALEAKAASVQLPCLPPPGKACIYVVRPDRMGAAVKFPCFIDTQEPAGLVGTLGTKKNLYKVVEPGSHTLWVKRGGQWARLPLNVQAGDLLFFRLTQNMNGFWGGVDIHPLPSNEGKVMVASTSVGKLA